MQCLCKVGRHQHIRRPQSKIGSRLSGHIRMATEQICADGVVYLREDDARLPYCVLWTTLPPLTYLIPAIGHVGITDSRGVPFDFSGPYQVTVGSLMCGPAKRIWKLSPDQMDGDFDAAVAEVARIYGKKMHNIVADNCHSHVAEVLNRVQYGGRKDWNQARVAWSVWRHGEWRNSRGWLLWAIWGVVVVGAIVISIVVSVVT